ncbi:MAG: RluA family pseudouridine synthase [Treponemataceae bacterium]
MKTLEVLYQNNEIMIINKPSGLATQGGAGIVHSVDRILEKECNQKVYLVHRLDKDTAGILVVAKNPVSAAKYTKIISYGEAKKTYCAFCTGTPAQKEGYISLSIEQDGKIKAAETFFYCEKNVTKEIEGTEYTFSKVFFELGTGRMHQIRIHAAQKNFPLIGDDKYGDFKKNKLLAKTLGIKKLQLASIALEIPIDGQRQQFSMELPSHMEEAQTLLF